MRRSRINAAYKEVLAGWEGVKDKNWLVRRLEKWLTWAFLSFKADAFHRSFSYDVRREQIVE